MKSLTELLVLLIVFSVAGCSSPQSGKEKPESPKGNSKELTGTIYISGAYALHPLISRMADEFMVANPGVKIEISKSGTGEGIADLLSGKCQLAMISRPLTDEESDKGIWVVAVAKDGVAPIVNQQNPNIDKILSEGISTDEFMEIFTSGKQLTWGDILGTGTKDRISVITRADQSGAADIFAAFFYRKATDLKGTAGCSGDDEMIAIVQEDPLAMGFCNFSYAFDDSTGEKIRNIQIVPCDLDFDNKIDRVEVPFRNLEEAHRSLWLGFYPDQLCRELTIGSMGKPADPVVVEFLRYILGDGQKNVKEKGFCPLNNVYIRYSLEMLD